jgi:hypothetical protein
MLSETQKQNLILVKERLEAWIDCHKICAKNLPDNECVVHFNQMENYQNLIKHLNAVLEEK